MAGEAFRGAGAVGMLAALTIAGCDRSDPHSAAKALIGAQCAACHVVPGVATAHGEVGPSLAGIARRQIIAGRLATNRAAMIAFLVHPRAIEPAGAMPEMGLSQAQAAMIADYLQTLDRP